MSAVGGEVPQKQTKGGCVNSVHDKGGVGGRPIWKPQKPGSRSERTARDLGNRGRELEEASFLW